MTNPLPFRERFEKASASKTTFSITDAQDFLHATALASGAHPVARFATGTDPLTFQTEGGSMMSITPAGSEGEYLAQFGAVQHAFEESVGRPPTETDGEFWTAINRLYDAYQGPTLDANTVTGGLA
jgi:hypothetical protein